MKRDIFCSSCWGGYLKTNKDSWRKKEPRTYYMVKRPKIGGSERIQVIEGAIKRPCICDRCSTELKIHDVAAARSIFAGADYYEWEEEFLYFPKTFLEELEGL